MLYMAGKRIKKLVRRLGPPVDEEDEGPNVECDEDEEENEPKRLVQILRSQLGWFPQLNARMFDNSVQNLFRARTETKAKP